MTSFHIGLGVVVIATSAGAALWGAWAWWRGTAPRGFWRLLRGSQAALAVQVALGALLLAAGRDPERLHVLYGLLPLGVSFIAEQLRLATADQVLARRGLDSVRNLPEAEQHAVVAEIVGREMLVMAASAAVVVLCGLRAAGWLDVG